MEADPDELAIIDAMMGLHAIERTGFPLGFMVGAGYELSGPLVGLGATPVPAMSVEPFFVGLDNITQLVQALGRADWAAAVLDDNSFVLTNNRADTHIPLGAHIPHNCSLLTRAAQNRAKRAVAAAAVDDREAA